VLQQRKLPINNLAFAIFPTIGHRAPPVRLEQQTSSYSRLRIDNPVQRFRSAFGYVALLPVMHLENRLGTMTSGTTDETIAAFVKPEQPVRCAGNANARANA
jgi:hypothetical protein